MGVASLIRGALVEQQTGAQPQEVPVKSIMKVVSEGVGELVETHKAKNAVGMLKDLVATGEPGPLDGLKHLKDIGIDLGTITGIHKEAAEVYKNMLNEEKAAKQEVAAIADKHRQEADQARAELTRLQMEMLVKLIDSRMSELEKKVSGEKGADRDPLTQTLKAVAARLVENSLSDVVKPKNPVEGIFETLQLADKLKEYFNLRSSGSSGDDFRRQALSDIKSEAQLKLFQMILEDERDREDRREKREIEKQKAEALREGFSFLKDNLTDAVRAVMEFMAARKEAAAQAPPAYSQEPAYTQEPNVQSNLGRPANVVEV